MKLALIALLFLPLFSFSQVENKIYDVVVLQARFPEGKDSLQTFFKTNINKKKIKPTRKNEGTISFQFTVLNTGYIKNISLISGLNKKIDNEFLRIIKLMPKWEPCEFAAKYIAEDIVLLIQINIDKKTKSILLNISTEHSSYPHLTK